MILLGLLTVVALWAVIAWIIVLWLRAWLRQREGRLRTLIRLYDGKVLWRIT